MGAVNATDAPTRTAFSGMLRLLYSGAWAQIDCALFAARKKDVITLTSGSRTLTAAESGSLLCNTGAAGAVTFVLPPATPGLEFFANVTAAQELRLDPDGSEVMALPSTGALQTGGKYLTANTIVGAVHIVCVDAGVWRTQSYLGTWTAV